MNNIATLNVGEVIKKLVPLFSNPEFSNYSQVPTVMMWGAPGVGKSDAVEQIAAIMSEKTGRPCHIHDMRLLLFNPVDLRGIPVPNNEKTEAIWLRPGVLPPAVGSTDYDPNAIYIVFLDEITAAPPSVQAAAYQLTLNRRIGEHELPPNTIILAAGNRITDKGVAYKMPTPLANRMVHFEVITDFDSWKDWAIPNGVHQWVLAFLNMGQGAKLNNFDPSSDSVAFPTPRTWMMVSKMLKLYKDDINQGFAMISGAIGQGTAVEFKAFVQTAHQIPNIDDILAGKNPPCPDHQPDVLYALAGALVSRADKFNATELKHVAEYTMSMSSKEFAVLIMRDMMRIDAIKGKLLTNPTWVKWARTHRNLIA